MQSAGISPIRLLIGLLVIPFCSIFISALLVSQIAPKTLAVWQRGFDPNLEPEVVNTDASEWYLDENKLVRRGPNSSRLVIERSSSGIPISWVQTARAGNHDSARVWRQGLGWRDEVFSQGASHESPSYAQRAVAVSPVGLPGASLTAGELFSAISFAAKRGLDPAPFKAELALRIALVAACLIIPLLAVQLSICGIESRFTRLVGYGIIAATAYWICLAAAWNGAVIGVWSSQWVSIGIPLFFLGVCVVLVLIAGRAPTRR